MREPVSYKDGRRQEFVQNVFNGHFKHGASFTLSTDDHFAASLWYTSADFSAIAFKFPGSWQSPEDQRLADEVQAKETAAKLAREKKLAAERKKRQEQEAAEKAAEMVREAEAKARAAGLCMSVYKTTIDKKQGDLTVREAQQIRACEALDLYPPN